MRLKTEIDFIRKLNELYVHVSEGNGAEIAILTEKIGEIRSLAKEQISEPHQAILDRYVRLIGLHVPVSLSLPLSRAGTGRHWPSAKIGEDLGEICSERPVGISLVTCAKNRTENLLKALPSWIAHSDLSEILIVDWSSDVPVADRLRAAKMDDPRIRIVRMEDEPHWILSYSFNVGFRVSSFDTILKADADIVLSADFFSRNRVERNCFIAGNWRLVEEGQEYLNGCFIAPVSALQKANGFNEFITTYGWDDDDLYSRLTLAGFTRHDLAPESAYHLPHSDLERVGKTHCDGENLSTMRKVIFENPRFMINVNRILAALMPDWDRSQKVLPCKVVGAEGNVLTLRREGRVPSEVPRYVLTTARNRAMEAFFSESFGARAQFLLPDVMELLLARPASEFSHLDVEVGIAAPRAILDGGGRYLLLDVQDQSIFSHPFFEEECESILASSRQHKLQPLVRFEANELPPAAPISLRELPVIPMLANIGTLFECTRDNLRSGLNLPSGNLILPLNAVTVSA
jgi:hypothetical protein